MEGPVGFWEAAASLTLIAVAVALSRWRRMDLERSILWAALRAAVQLLAVGALLRVIFEASWSWVWAGLWIAAMVVIAAGVARRRARHVPGLAGIALAAIGGSAAVALALVFVPDVIPPEPVTLVVIAGITIGNTMPATVLAVDQAVQALVERRSEVEGLLALGFGGPAATRFVVARTARTALIPQIERTKVVGLIALPGAMTGLLLAGVEPVSAVLVQLVVMYVVLGSVATSVVVVSVATVGRSLTPDLRLREWTRSG